MLFIFTSLHSFNFKMGFFDSFLGDIHELSLKELVAAGILLGGLIALALYGLKFFFKYFGHI